MEGGDPKYKREGELKKIDKLLNRKKEKFIANKYVEDILKNTTFAHTPTLYKIISQGKVGADAFNLYTFYCYTASWQETNSVYATDYYCRKGLHWGEKRFRRAKNLLLKMKLIEQKITKDKKTNKIIGHYIYIKYRKNPKG